MNPRAVRRADIGTADIGTANIDTAGKTLVQTFGDAAAFASEALPFLRADEAVHNLQLGVVDAMLGGRLEASVLVVLRDRSSGAIEAVATRSADSDLVISGGGAAAMAELCHRLSQLGLSVPGVVGPHDSAADFTRPWCQAHSLRAVTTRRMGLFVADAVSAPLPPNGHAVKATVWDAPLVLNWCLQFHRELKLRSMPPSVADIRTQIGSGSTWLWLRPGNEPAALATIGRQSETGASVTCAFTPVPLRGQGFASACVAHACAAMFSQGKRFCALYADLDNPTATGMYSRLGFALRAGTDQVAFLA